jgi:hypothetical protein
MQRQLMANQQQHNFSTTASYVDKANCTQNLTNGQLCEQCALLAREIMQLLHTASHIMPAAEFQEFLSAQPADVRTAYQQLH